MAISLTSTSQVVATSGVKFLVYGAAGVGKTLLCATASRPIILSAEAGLLSLRKWEIPVIEITCYEQMVEAYNYLMSSAGDAYDTICIDSITEIAEVAITASKAKYKDARLAYGDLFSQMMNIVRLFRDMPRFNVYFSAQQTYEKNEMGVFKYTASMPGKQVGKSIPYALDEVFHMDIGKDASTGQSFRFLRTEPDLNYEAKDRSGTLNKFEEPNIINIINKIKGV